MEPYRRTTEGQVMGIIGIVLGVIAIIVAFIPCVGVVAYIPGGFAIIFSVISIVQATRGDGAKALGIAALIISMLAILLATAWLMVFSGMSVITNKAIREYKIFDQIEKGIKETSSEDFEEVSSIRADSLIMRLRELEEEKEKIENEIKQEKQK